MDQQISVKIPTTWYEISQTSAWWEWLWYRQTEIIELAVTFCNRFAGAL
jgi:hypothetical protein